MNRQHIGISTVTDTDRAERTVDSGADAESTPSTEPAGPIPEGTSTTPLRALSLGGGWQSACILLMACAGQLDPLDVAVFADTGGEMPQTYSYLDYLQQQAEDAGIGFLRVSAGNLRHEVIARAGRSMQPNLPVRVRNPDGTLGRLTHYHCSYDFKRRPIAQAIKRLCGGPGAWKHTTVEQWIGYSTDEVLRLKPSDECRCGHKRARLATRQYSFQQIHDTDGCTRCDCTQFDPWQVNRWPLIELGMTRNDCRDWIVGHGHPAPQRSACSYCPNRGNAHFRALKSEHPELWRQAVELDRFVRHGMNGIRGMGYLHHSGVPLAEADLRSATEKAASEGQQALFADESDTDCDAGACFT